MIKIIEKNVDELIPYENNARINDKAVEAVAKSIKEFGMKNPILIDNDNVIIAGHTRLKALKSLGVDIAPCIIADDLTEEQIKAFRIADNSTAQIADWDLDKLNEELKSIDYDMSEFGLAEQIKEIEKEFAEEIIEDEVPEVDEKNIITRLGDIWQLGRHRLMCGDSTDKKTVEKLMNDNKADMVFTDPPYNVAFNGRSGNFDVIKNDDLTEEDFNLFIGGFVDILNYLKPKHYYIWCNWKFYGILQQLLEFKACIVWAKNVFGLGKGYRHQHEFCLFNGNIDEYVTNESDLWQVKKDSNYVHPTQKPLELSARAIKNHKAVKNVVDLFGGSGGTLITCEQLNRTCYMMELDPKYVQVILERYIAFKGTSEDVYRINADGTKTKYADIKNI